MKDQAAIALESGIIMTDLVDARDEVLQALRRIQVPVL